MSAPTLFLLGQCRDALCSRDIAGVGTEKAWPLHRLLQRLLWSCPQHPLRWPWDPAPETPSRGALGFAGGSPGGPPRFFKGILAWRFPFQRVRAEPAPLSPKTGPGGHWAPEQWVRASPRGPRSVTAGTRGLGGPVTVGLRGCLKTEGRNVPSSCLRVPPTVFAPQWLRTALRQAPVRQRSLPSRGLSSWRRACRFLFLRLSELSSSPTSVWAWCLYPQ